MKTNHIYFGAAYYDEYLPYDRLEQDMQMMEDAHINLIRIAESTWSTLEPEEGHYNFYHIDRVLDAAKAHHIQVIIGTPTYAVPAWLVKKSDDLLTLTHSGKSIYGHRQNMDLTNPVYREYAEKIIRVLLSHVASHPAVIGYQIDNETHHYDTCGPRVQKMFVDYLKTQFPDIQDFNQRFGLDYWSNRVDCWEDFPDIRGTINGSLAAEFEKFQRSLVTDFHHWQAALIREYRRPDQFITHNFDFEWHNYSFGLQPDTDQFASALCMDVAGGDIYHPSQKNLTGAEITFCGSILRGLKQSNYLILETQAQGNPEWLPYPGQLRLCAYSHLSNGSNSIMYWHWHSIHNAIESYWKGVLSHDFSAGRIYQEAAVLGSELDKIGSKLVNIRHHNRTAILLDPASLTGLCHFPTGTMENYSYNTVARWLSDSLYRQNIPYDILFSEDPDLAEHLEQYQILFLPSLYSAKDSLLKLLEKYTFDGGILVAAFRTAFSDEYLKIRHDTQPHFLHKCFGVHYDQFTFPENVELSFHLADPGSKKSLTGTAREWMELLTPETAVSLAEYVHPAWNGYSAITENSFGLGKAFYIGCMFDESVLDRFISHVAKCGNISVPSAHFPVIIRSGINDFDEQIHYYLNYSDQTQTITYTQASGTELLSGTPICTGQQLTLNPWDVKIICSE